jgi:hypothetical protein
MSENGRTTSEKVGITSGKGRKISWNVGNCQKGRKLLEIVGEGRENEKKHVWMFGKSRKKVGKSWEVRNSRHFRHFLTFVSILPDIFRPSSTCPTFSDLLRNFPTSSWHFPTFFNISHCFRHFPTFPTLSDLFSNVLTLCRHFLT